MDTWSGHALNWKSFCSALIERDNTHAGRNARHYSEGCCEPNIKTFMKLALSRVYTRVPLDYRRLSTAHDVVNQKVEAPEVHLASRRANSVCQLGEAAKSEGTLGQSTQALSRTAQLPEFAYEAY